MLVECSKCGQEHNYNYEKIAKKDLNENFKEKAFQYEVNLEFCCTRDA